MASPLLQPKLSPEDRAEVTKLLGEEKWGPVVEQLMPDRHSFLQEGQPRPAMALPDEVVNEIRRELRKGKKLSERVVTGHADVAKLKQWLASIEQNWTGWLLETFDWIASASELPVRGSGARGKRKSPRPEPLPEPTSFPLNLTGGIPSMANAALLAQPGRIDLPALTIPGRFHHGPRPPAPIADGEFAERYAWQIDFAMKALNASRFPSGHRPGHPTTNMLDTALVIRLAYVWNQAHGKWPKRHHRGDQTRDSGPFLKLATLCVGPFRPLQPASREVEEIVRTVLARLPRDS